MCRAFIFKTKYEQTAANERSIVDNFNNDVAGTGN